MSKKMRRKYFDMISFLKKQLIELGLSYGTVVDIGAYDGTNVIATADVLCGFDFHVIEPFPRSFERLYVKTKDRSNIVCYEVAITNKIGVTTLYGITGEDKQHRTPSCPSIFQKLALRKVRYTAQSKKYKAIEPVQVNTMSLKDFCLIHDIGHINLLKINCEGSELLIFEDKSSHKILFDTDIIYLSLHGKLPMFLSSKFEKRKRNVNRLLNKWGFKIVYGENLERENVAMPQKHANQVWVKS